MKNHMINALSRLAGLYFAFVWKRGWISENHKGKALDVYVSLRRKLPTMACGNHWGNHIGSTKRPYRATQGM